MVELGTMFIEAYKYDSIIVCVIYDKFWGRVMIRVQLGLGIIQDYGYVSIMVRVAFCTWFTKAQCQGLSRLEIGDKSGVG